MIWNLCSYVAQDGRRSSFSLSTDWATANGKYRAVLIFEPAAVSLSLTIYGADVGQELEVLQVYHHLGVNYNYSFSSGGIAPLLERIQRMVTEDRYPLKLPDEQALRTFYPKIDVP
jgi:hypothetical protein